jgi:hypothetical protein
MKVDLFQTIIAIAIGALISYGFYIFNESDNNIIFSMVSFVILSTSLIFLLGTNFELTRTATKIRVVSGVFFVLAMISNLLFTFINFTILSIVITYGFIFLVYISVMYSLYTNKKIALFFSP